VSSVAYVKADTCKNQFYCSYDLVLDPMTLILKDDLDSPNTCIPIHKFLCQGFRNLSENRTHRQADGCDRSQYHAAMWVVTIFLEPMNSLGGTDSQIAAYPARPQTAENPSCPVCCLRPSQMTSGHLAAICYNYCLVPEMSYKVSSGTLSLYSLTITIAPTIGALSSCWQIW